MKHVRNTSVSILVALLALLAGGCASTSSTTVTDVGSTKERLLTQAGFTLHDATTAKQQARLNSLPQGHVTSVKYHGRIYYAYRKGTSNQVYIGNKAQYRTYRQSLQAEKARLAQTDAAAANDPMFTEEVEGPNPVLIREYDGWGPLFPSAE